MSSRTGVATFVETGTTAGAWGERSEVRGRTCVRACVRCEFDEERARELARRGTSAGIVGARLQGLARTPAGVRRCGGTHVVLRGTFSLPLSVKDQITTNK